MESLWISDWVAGAGSETLALRETSESLALAEGDSDEKSVGKPDGLLESPSSTTSTMVSTFIALSPSS